MKTYIFGVLCGFLLTACAIISYPTANAALQTVMKSQEPAPLPDQTSGDPEIKFEQAKLIKGCYLLASGYQEAYDAQMTMAGRKHWAKIMYVDIVTKEGHAICVFQRNGAYHVYDNLMGTTNLGKFDKPPTPQELMKRYKSNYENASWLE